MITFPQVGSRKKTRTRERGDVGHARLRGDRHGRARCRRADGADQGEDLLLLDQLKGIDDGGFGFVGVIDGNQFQLPAVDAAKLVDLVEGRLDAAPHVRAELLRGGR